MVYNKIVRSQNIQYQTHFEGIDDMIIMMQFVKIKTSYFSQNSIICVNMTKTQNEILKN